MESLNVAFGRTLYKTARKELEELVGKDKASKLISKYMDVVGKRGGYYFLHWVSDNDILKGDIYREGKFGNSWEAKAKAISILIDHISEVQTIIVSRHQGALDWIRKHHPEFKNCEVIAHVGPHELKGNRVVGILPVHLAAQCKEYWHLSMDIPSEFRGVELSMEEMEKLRCKIKRYNVEPV